MAPKEAYDLSTWNPELHRRPGRTRSESKQIQSTRHRQSPSPSPPIPTQKSARKGGKVKENASKRARSVGQDAKVTKRTAATTNTTNRHGSKLPAPQKAPARALSSKAAPSKAASESSVPVVEKKAAKGASQTTKAKAKTTTEATTKAESKSATSKASSARSTHEASARVSKERAPRPRKPWERLPTDCRGTAKETAPGTGSWFTSDTPGRIETRKQKAEKEREAAAARKKKAAEQVAAKRAREAASAAAIPKPGGPAGTGALLNADGPSTNGLKHLSATSGEWLGPRHREKIERYDNLSDDKREEVDALWYEIMNASIGGGDITVGEITPAIREHMLAYASHNFDNSGSERWMKRARTSLVTCAAREKEGAVYVEPKGRQ